MEAGAFLCVILETDLAAANFRMTGYSSLRKLNEIDIHKEQSAPEKVNFPLQSTPYRSEVEPEKSLKKDQTQPPSLDKTLETLKQLSKLVPVYQYAHHLQFDKILVHEIIAEVLTLLAAVPGACS